MPIEVKCGQCGKGLKAPDSMAGKKAKCPGCGAVIVVPAAEEEILDAELVEPSTSAPAGGLGDLLDDEVGYRVQEPDPTPAASGDERRPCPACGEMIPINAAKCRFCNEIFDASLRRKEKKKSSSADDEMSTGDWVLAILCSGIGCIVGIVWMIQGKKKGAKMVGISILVAVIWNVISVAVQQAAKH